jgi:DNA helicase-2/ATP-dependent DNA helicase PcrA
MDESGLKGLEEERRLAYVGITRARELCYITFASNRLIFTSSFRGWQSQLPSRFIDELPAVHVDVLTPPGLYGGGFGAAAPRMGGIEERATRADVYNSPGWRRLQERSQLRPVSQPREARNQIIDLDATSAFGEDDRVFHRKFGYGTVLATEGDKLEIAFDKAGVKHVVATYVIAADEVDDVPF